MKTLYLDSEFRCHLSNPEGQYTTLKTDIFDDKCDAFIEGYRFVPEGESWTRSDGVVFEGEMRSPWKDYDELDEAQRAYEQERLADAENALAILLGGEST